VKYDAKYDRQNDYSTTFENKYIIDRLVSVSFIPSVVTFNNDKVTASRKSSSVISTNNSSNNITNTTNNINNNNSNNNNNNNTHPSIISRKISTQSMVLLQNMTQPVTETIDATVTIQSLEDMAEIEIKFKAKSNILKTNNCAAINIDQKLSICVHLPSILFADDALRHDYYVNLAKGATIEYMINSKPTIVL
jgi:hypothetical protein